MNLPKKEKQQFKRKKLYINKSFQTSFILKFVLIIVLGGAISICLTLFTCNGTLTTSFMNSKLVVQKTCYAIMPSVIYTNLITTAVIVLIAVVVTLVISHKIAGPMFRFEKDIQRVAQGDLKSRIYIRKGDQLEEMANSLNSMIDSLNQKVSAVRAELGAFSKKRESEEISLEILDSIIAIESKIDQMFEL